VSGADAPEVAVRPAVEGDLAALCALERAGFDDPWSPPQLAAELRLPGALVLVATAPGGPLHGYAIFRTFAGEAELLRVATAPDRRRQGVARTLLAAGYAHLAAAGADIVHLEAEAANAAAIRLYESEGFHRVGRRVGYYGAGRDALLYARSLRPGQSPAASVGRPGGG
jgi:[ribosomal protein S18]-alanine N-acetyltransferase